jgi:hypothetical protein
VNLISGSNSGTCADSSILKSLSQDASGANSKFGVSDKTTSTPDGILWETFTSSLLRHRS